MRTTNVPTPTLELVRKPERVPDGAALEEIARLIAADPVKTKTYYNIPSAIQTPLRGQVVVRTCYGPDFSALIRLSGISSQKLWETLHMEKAPLTAEEAELLEGCAALAPQVMTKYALLAKQIIDPQWLNTTDIPSPRSVLQYYAQQFDRAKKIAFKKRIKEDPEAGHDVSRCLDAYFPRIPLDKIAYTSKMLCGISPHYFLRLDKDIHLYTDNDDIEEFFDIYTLLPKLWKDVLRLSICKGGSKT